MIRNKSLPRFPHLLLSLLLATACASERAAPTPNAPTGACVRSFRAVLEAWETLSRTRVPEECAFLDAEYNVVLARDIPECEGEPIGVNEQTAACTLPAQRTILILDALDDLQRLDMSVHEWIHALSDCVYGDPDTEHLRAGLWVRFGTQSTEAQAFAGTEPGECL